MDGSVVVPAEGKCRHGSSFDDPQNVGSNKDTASYRWSPHANLHSSAATLAITSIQRYLDNLRFNVNDERFAQLFSLSQGSALVIAIDTSPSVDDEIEAAKAKVAEIVNSAEQTGVKPTV